MKLVVSVVIAVLGFIAFYIIWPQSINLPKIGKVNEWSLTEVSGKEVSIQKKPKLITFFFTNCPDVCPTTMWDLTELQQLLREKGISDDQYLFLSVTLDPEYDTNERIIDYKEIFGITSSNWLFLRGSEGETRRFTQYFNFYYDKNKEGFVTHSTSMYLVDSNDEIRAFHEMAIGNKRVNIEEIATHLQELLK